MLLLLVNFLSWFRLKFYVYILHSRYQINSHSSPRLLVACATATVHSNHFFVCTNRINFLNLRSNSGRLVIVTNWFLKLKKLVYTDEAKESFTSQKRNSRDFWRIANNVLNKSKSDIPPLSNDLRCCLLHI